MGVLIPARVACACPRHGLVAAPLPGGTFVLDDGQWKLDGREGDSATALGDWAATACAHGLALVDTWALLHDVLNLRSWLRRFDDHDSAALDELAAAFCLLPGESGNAPLTYVVDSRHRDALTRLREAIPRLSAPYLVDTDTKQVIAGPPSVRGDGSGSSEEGFAGVRSIITPGPPYSFSVPYDSDGIRLEQDGAVLFRARRVSQEVVGTETTRFVDLDTGQSITSHGLVGLKLQMRSDPRPREYPTRFHVEERQLPPAHLGKVRAALTQLVEASLETGHCILFYDRLEVD